MKTTKMITMKTIYMVAVFLGLQFNTIFAAENLKELPGMSNEVLTIGTSRLLMPVTPVEATFEDISETNASDLNLFALAPIIPLTADFNDEAPALETCLINLVPVTQKEADFEDATGTKNASSIRDLAPVTPADVIFEYHD